MQQSFLKYYLSTSNGTYSAYMAGVSKINQFFKYEDLTYKQKQILSRRATLFLRNAKIKKELKANIESLGKVSRIADLNEVLETLTLIIRRVKQEPKNSECHKTAIRAMELLVRHYPDFDNPSNEKDEKITFSRGNESDYSTNIKDLNFSRGDIN